jgi:CRISPR system Cascade subunit CasA
MFFGMPRRIKLLVEKIPTICDLTGEHTETSVTSYKTKNYGINYDGPWLHPLNAYSVNPKKPDEPPLSIKGQPGGITYRHWSGLAISSENQTPAKVVQLLNSSSVRRKVLEDCGANVWASGYDMDNMKARCWYESTMPLFPLSPEDSTVVKSRISYLVNAASEVAANLRTSVKSAWFSRPKDVKGDMSFLDTSFWQQTEPAFYQNLARLVNDPADRVLVAEIATTWEKKIRNMALDLFDTWALSAQEDGLDMKRVVLARRDLLKWLKNGKQMKELKNLQTIAE